MNRLVRSCFLVSDSSVSYIQSFQGLPDNTPNGYGLARTVLFKLLMTRFAIIWAVRKDEGEQYGITKETKRNITGLNKLLALWVEVRA